ncbi:hypothetical protein DIX60_08750 [Streptococcus iniae]|uniref:hypothetical protein n=1 Tax=Streptococcus iniae TaxID=1346 RepID=UPI0008D94B54|nr:hypothetical protein [Streptococcus iniae]OHX28284.1 hypothetical protein BKX95_00040 [Streptococcus iniae]RLV27099.1 hypothetical protein DIX60_08750 [Streptococcus iniae]
MVEAVALVWIVEKALYGNIKKIEKANPSEFRSALYGNLFWMNFSDNRATKGKIIFAWFFTTFITLFGFSPLLIIGIISKTIGDKIGSEIFGFSILGIMPACAMILIWQNNLIRFFRIARLYQQRKLKVMNSD